MQRCGLEVSYMHKFHVVSQFLRHPILLYARLRNKILSRKKRTFFSPSPYSISETRENRLDEFAAKHYREVSFLDNASWKKTVASNTVFVAGSDIIWQPALGYPAKNFLDFAVLAGLPCFSYASSIGSPDLPKKYHRAYRRYLGAFRDISVREEAAAKMLEPIICKPVTKVVDPTLLLDSSDWNTFSDQAQLSVEAAPSGFVFCYFVMDDQRYWDYVASVHEQTGLQVIVLPMHYRDEEQPYSIVLDGTPYEFVWLIKNAEFVLTDSFHACAFSLQYEKEFYLIRRTRKAEDDKYNDFLGRYNLISRVVDSEKPFERRRETDYSCAIKQLAKDRADSYAFLQKAVSNM